MKIKYTLNNESTEEEKDIFNNILYKNDYIKKIEGKIDYICRASDFINAFDELETYLSRYKIATSYLQGSIIVINQSFSTCNAYQYRKNYVSYSFERGSKAWFLIEVERQQAFSGNYTKSHEYHFTKKVANKIIEETNKDFYIIKEVTE